MIHSVGNLKLIPNHILEIKCIYFFQPPFTVLQSFKFQRVEGRRNEIKHEYLLEFEAI